MNRIGIMQVTDTLAAGGLERVAVNLANALPRGQYDSHLCATREQGPLAELVASHVRLLHLARAGRFDVRAVRRLAGYVRANRIQILHAHGTSLFIAVMASLFKPHPVVLWHDHFGRSATGQRSVWIYRLAVKGASGVLAVNQALAEWSRTRLRVPPNRVWCMPNFVCEPKINGAVTGLPGRTGLRIVCVANLRPEKDHLTLLRAMRRVVQEFPEAHLLLLGRADDKAWFEELRRAIAQSGLTSHVSWLGSRNDVAAVLDNCDVGVLSSASEGSPLALIEYGMAGLPVVATNAGQCAEVLEEGRAGLLVPPAEPAILGDAILLMLRSPEKRVEFAGRFSRRVRELYSAERVVKQICQVYGLVLKGHGNSQTLTVN